MLKMIGFMYRVFHKSITWCLRLFLELLGARRLRVVIWRTHWGMPSHMASHPTMLAFSAAPPWKPKFSLVGSYAEQGHLSVRQDPDQSR